LVKNLVHLDLYRWDLLGNCTKLCPANANCRRDVK